MPSRRSAFVGEESHSGLGPRDTEGYLTARPDDCAEVVVRREVSVPEPGAETLWKVQGLLVRPTSRADVLPFSEVRVLGTAGTAGFADTAIVIRLFLR